MTELPFFDLFVDIGEQMAIDEAWTLARSLRLAWAESWRAGDALRRGRLEDAMVRAERRAMRREARKGSGASD